MVKRSRSGNEELKLTMKEKLALIASGAALVAGGVAVGNALNAEGDIHNVEGGSSFFMEEFMDETSRVSNEVIHGIAAGTWINVAVGADAVVEFEGGGIITIKNPIVSEVKSADGNTRIAVSIGDDSPDSHGTYPVASFLEGERSITSVSLVGSESGEPFSMGDVSRMPLEFDHGAVGPNGYTRLGVLQVDGSAMENAVGDNDPTPYKGIDIAVEVFSAS